MKLRIRVLLMLSITALLIVACNDDNNSDDADCRVGSEECSCTAEGSCDAGLTCISEICVDVSDDDANPDGDSGAGDDGEDSEDGEEDGDDDSDPPAGQVHLTIDTNASVHPISPYIYGTNQPEWEGKTSGCTIDRLGGNRWTAYNWENNASNAGLDWYYSNDDYLGGGNTAGEAVRLQVQAAFDAGASAVVTVPIAGYVSADKNGTVDISDDNRFNTRFNVSYPVKGTAFDLTPVTTDGVVYQDEFVNWLITQFPDSTTNSDNMIFFDLDNEPGLWSYTHEEIHPEPTTYAELLERTVDYASGIKAVVPNATIFGFVSYGYNSYENLQNAPDSEEHGDFINYFLDGLAQAEMDYGQRLVDVLDVHWYSEARSSGDVRITTGGNSDDIVVARVQAPRSLWDPSYMENSWITSVLGEPIQILRRLKQQINDHYPGTRLAVTEYSHGGENHISGAIAQADTLGIFGREEIFAALTWNLGEDDAYQYAAFDMFRNFDGNGGAFGDTHISADTSDIETTSVYASYDSDNPDRMVIVAINRSSDALSATFDISASNSFLTARVFQLTDAAASPTAAGTVNIENNSFVYTLPEMSVTTFELVTLVN